MATRTIAGLAFQVHSPSLYTYDADGGTVALEYNGAGLWAVRCISPDQPETAHYYVSLAEIAHDLTQRETQTG